VPGDEENLAPQHHEDQEVEEGGEGSKKTVDGSDPMAISHRILIESSSERDRISEMKVPVST
jgi:hypothetical protein